MRGTWMAWVLALLIAAVPAARHLARPHAVESQPAPASADSHSVGPAHGAAPVVTGTLLVADAAARRPEYVAEPVLVAPAPLPR